MTRLTEEQIGALWRASYGVDEFAHRIAALAVQEVERERMDLIAEASSLHTERATLTAQLAEARADERLAVANADRMTDEVASLRAQLATAKREERIEGFKDGWHDAIERAMDMGLVDLGSFPITGRRKRERTKGEEWAIAGLGANEAASKRYPAIDPDSGSTCKPDCCLPNYCAPGKGCHANVPGLPDSSPATPSYELCDADCGCKPPEAREVPREVVVRVETRRGIGWYSNGETIVCITPADAKRIVALAQEAE
jgi:hypothetical protein